MFFLNFDLIISVIKDTFSASFERKCTLQYRKFRMDLVTIYCYKW